MREPNTPESPSFAIIGTRPIRHDGEDKVTGRAQYGADVSFRDQLYGKVLRSPHAHARIVSLDVGPALKMPGVKAIATSEDLPRLEERIIDTGEGIENLRFMSDRILARDRVLFKGHPIAAVAATDPWTAEEACKAIVVRYEELPAFVDVMEALKAEPLHGEIFTETIGQKVKKATNVCRHTQHKQGDVEKGFAEADLVIEREFTTKTVHQGYIEPQNATALWRNDGQITIWTSTQGQFPVRDQVATVLKLPLSRVKVVPMEIGGGFGGKIPIYLEPVAALLSKKAGHPVKMVMTRAEVFQATGPASSTASRIKIGVKKDGKLTAAQAWLAYEAGAFPNDMSVRAGMCVLAPYKLDHLLIDALDVMTNTTKIAAYRAPASPQALFGVESVMDEIALQLNIDPLELRMMNAVQEGDRRAEGPPFRSIGLKQVLRAAMDSDHYKSPAPRGPYKARGVATGFWFNAGLQSSAAVGINMDGTASVITGSVDIGGSRASLAMMAAETLGLKVNEVRPSVADTESIGHTDVTGGSRVTFATGLAVHEACEKVLAELKKRVAILWETKEDAIEWRGGAFHHAGNGKQPMTVKQLGPLLTKTGGPVMGSASVAPKAVGAGFGVHLADVEVDPETGKVTILRYTAVHDVGRAIHPSYVEGQMQGGALQGIGWAMNEEYIHNAKGEMLNPGFLDYRMPTMLDAPNIETVMVEVPNPAHPYGVRGIGETPIVPPLGTLHNAISRAIGVRLRSLPMSPPKVRAAIESAKKEPVAAPAR